jgi:RES domain
MQAHDGALLDVLSEYRPEVFEGEVWRITRKGLDPLRGSTAHGRWSAGPDIEVVYTSLERDGALAEIGFRMGLEPVWPSRLEHDIHALSTMVERTLKIMNFKALEELGVDTSRYESFNYAKTKAIAAAAHFLEFDGMMVPSARSACQHLVLFKERVKDLRLVKSQPVDWVKWRQQLTQTDSSLI